MQAKSFFTVASIVFPAVLVGLFVGSQNKAPQPLSLETQVSNEVKAFVVAHNPTMISADSVIRNVPISQHVKNDQELAQLTKEACDITDDTNPFFLGDESMNQDQKANAVVAAAMNTVAIKYYCPDKYSTHATQPTIAPQFTVTPVAVHPPVTQSQASGIHTNNAVNPEFNAIVFDPPSNCRAMADSASPVVISFKQYGEVAVNARNPQNGWYFEVLNECWIHESQLKFK
jgi:hypothetical protein